MRNSVIIIITLLSACTSRPVGLDDEAGVTTAMGESSSATTDESGSTTAVGEDSTSDDASVTFVPLDEDLSHHPCDSFLQDCPPGEKCVPYASSGGNWDDNKCVPIMGDQQVGETCWWGGIVEATDNCDATSICWDAVEVDGELIGTCVQQCQGTADAPECPPGSSCILASDGPIAICIPSCDPLVQDCRDGLACYWANIDFSCIFTTEDLPAGEPCGFINDCAAGLICIDATALPNCAGSACCTAYCDLTVGDADCVAQPGTACVPFFEEGMAPPGDENIGWCVLAP